MIHTAYSYFQHGLEVHLFHFCICRSKVPCIHLDKAGNEAGTKSTPTARDTIPYFSDSKSHFNTIHSEANTAEHFHITEKSGSFTRYS